MKSSIIVGFAIGACMFMTPYVFAKQQTKQQKSRSIDYVKTLRVIARDIEGLKKEFPQLKKFSAKKHINIERLSISYAYHTHAPERRVGWTGGVPNPDDDGIWFYIDFYAPDSQAQIHTQPVMIPAYIGAKRVAFLILQGRKTVSIERRLWAILEKHGIKRGEIGEE